MASFNSFWTEPVTVAREEQADIISNQQQRQHGEIVETIKNLLSPKGITVLHIAIVGSYAKGMNSKNGHSDFDTKVLALHSHRDYLLQKVNKGFQFQTHITAMKMNDDKDPSTQSKIPVTSELEGTVSDYTTMMKYVVGNNQQACYEMFTGVCIYTTRAAQKLHDIWRYKAYDAASLQLSRNGQLFGYKKQVIGTSATRKLACEAVYLSLVILYLERRKQSPPPCPIFDLLECMASSDHEDDLASDNEDDHTIIIDPVTKAWIQDLVALRIQDKTADYVITQDMQNLMEQALQAKAVVARTEKTTRSNEEQVMLVEEVEDLFLRVIAS